MINVDHGTGVTVDIAFGFLAVDLGGLMEHQTGGNNGTDDCSQIADEHRNAEAFTNGRAQTDHKGGDDQAHAEGSADVAQSRQLVFLEETAEIVVLSQSQNGGVVGQVGGENTHSAGTGQAVQRLDQGGHQLVQQEDNTEFGPQGGNRTGQNGNGHDVEDRIDQQIMGSIHHGVEHIGGTHFRAQQDEEAEEDHNKNGNFLADGLLDAFRQNFLFFLFKHKQYLSKYEKSKFIH